MAVPTGRTDKRIPKKAKVELAFFETPESKETALAQNVSARGMRVATERIWRPGDNVVLSSREWTLRTQARVIYCERLTDNKFAVGLQLCTPLGEWATR